MNTYNITADLVVEIYVDGNLVDWPGPWSDLQAAEAWAQDMIAALDAGTYSYTGDLP